MVWIGVKIKWGLMNHSLIDILKKNKKFTIIEAHLAVKPLLSPLDLGLNPKPNSPKPC